MTKSTEKPSITDIYQRGAELLPPEYLVCHQEATAEEKARVLAQAAERRGRRAAKRMTA